MNEPTTRKPGLSTNERTAGRPASSTVETNVERLQRTLARAGYGSRRAAEELISAGRVTVDGRTAELGDRADPRVATIEVDGVPIPADPELRYLAFNKPAGVTSTMADRHAERSLAEFVPEGPRIFPVGRLDRESEGLLLLTNDGELANRILHPRYGVEKEYLVEVQGTLSAAAATKLRRGVRLADGMARAIRVGQPERVAGRSSVTVVMGEGRKREVRRMFDAVGNPVQRLVRVRQGPVKLVDLPPGEARPLTPLEVRELYAVTGVREAAPRPRRQRRNAPVRKRRRSSARR
jgi:23S rRNA pseudouridine2605 synthase